MVDRRSFLKGLGASLLVPTPKLWTPEERQLVLADDIPEPEPQPVPHAPTGTPGGYLLGVLPSPRCWTHPPAVGGRWSAFYTEPHTVTARIDHDLPFSQVEWRAGRNEPYLTRYTFEFEVYGPPHGPFLYVANRDTPGDAARAVIEARARQ